MASAIIPFNFAAPAVALAKKRENSANNIFLSANAPSYPELSIKGKVFTLVKGDVRKVLTRKLTGEDGTIEEVAITTIPLVVVAGNPKSRVFYDKGYTEGADNQKPACYSLDGVSPDAQADKPQSKKCQICPHAKWGSKVRTDDGEAKGTACSPRLRLAVTDPNTPAAPFMLNVPPGSASNWRGAVAMAENHGKDFFEVAFKVKFDMEAPTPKLVFEPYGMLTDEALEKVKALQAEPVVQEILGVANPLPDDAPVSAPAPAAAAPAAPPASAPAPKPPAKPAVTDDELLGALGGSPLATEAEAQAKAATQKAKAEAKPKAEKPAAAKVEQPKPAAEPAAVTDDLLGGLQNLLGMTDD